MSDNKQTCKKYHVPPMGRKCKRLEKKQEDVVPELFRDAAVSQVTDHEDEASLNGQQIQQQILTQLERVNKRLDDREDRVAGVTVGSATKPKLSKDFLSSDKAKLSKNILSSSIKKSSKTKKVVETSSESSFDDSDTPSLDTLRSYSLQRQVDKRNRDLERSSQSAGEKIQKIKSKRGGNVEVTVNEKVSWPHEPILGELQRQRINYDQLSLTQWVQGFCRNILEESSVEHRDAMVSYMGDLMEDATDFSWQSAKAAHAVMLCEMERGVLTWEDTDRIDRIWCAHAQKYLSNARQGWAKSGDNNRKPWFCKNYQQGLCSHSKEHEMNGRTHKHICAFCLSNGRQLAHAEKELYVQKICFKKRTDDCSSIGWSSQDVNVVGVVNNVNSSEGKNQNLLVGQYKVRPGGFNAKVYRTKFVYNSKVSPNAVDALLAKKT